MVKKKNRRYPWLAAFLVLAIELAGFSYARYNFQNSAPQTVQAEAVTSPTVTPIATVSTLGTPPTPKTSASVAPPIPTPFVVQTSAVQAAMQKVISAHPELTIGASFIATHDFSRTDVNGDQVFTAASTAKIFIASLLLHRVETGKNSLDQTIDGVSLATHLQQMVNQSNNDSWMDLMEFMGYQNQLPYAESIGITTYDFQNNRISPNDDALLLAKLYTGQLLNQADTKLLLSYMQNTNMEDLIPPAVPAGVIVYHKYGDYEDNLHDTAIIDDGKNPFVLTIYTSDGNREVNYTDRYAVFHDLVKAVEGAMNITGLGR